MASGMVSLAAAVARSARIFHFRAPIMQASMCSPPSQTEESVVPPIRVFGVPGRYATSLYQAASKDDSLEEVQENLESLVDLREENEVLDSYLKNPLIAKEDKSKMLEDIANADGYHATTKTFLMMLAENGRLNQTVKIVESFQEILMAHFGEVRAVVTSAHEVPEAEMQEIYESVQMMVPEGTQLNVETVVDPKILGGLIVEVGDKMVDLSIESQIKKMEGVLKSAL